MGSLRDPSVVKPLWEGMRERKGLQLCAQSGSIGFYQVDIIKKNSSCGRRYQEDSEPRKSVC
jgi:hypothetical protein